MLLETRAADYSPGVRTRIESGRAISAVDYLKAQSARAALRAAVDALLSGKAPSADQIPSIGCNIKWKQS